MSLYATYFSNNSGGSGGGGTLTIGTIDSQTKAANGGVITASQLFFQTADTTHPGLVSTASQTFAGAKTFTGVLSVNTIHDITVGDGITIAGTSGAGVTGAMTLQSGDSSDDASGSVNVVSGNSVNNSGNVFITSGNSSGASSGIIGLTTGTKGGGGARGSVDIDASALNLYSATYFNLNTAIVSGGQFEAVDGSASAPSFHFGNDVNTGMYSVGADQLGFATNGANRLTIENHTVTFTLTSTPSPGQILPDSDYNLDLGTSAKHLNDIWGYETFMSFYKFEDGDVGAGAIMGHIQSSASRGIYLETLDPYRSADVTLDTEGNIFLKTPAVKMESGSPAALSLLNTELPSGAVLSVNAKNSVSSGIGSDGLIIRSEVTGGIDTYGYIRVYSQVEFELPQDQSVVFGSSSGSADDNVAASGVGVIAGNGGDAVNATVTIAGGSGLAADGNGGGVAIYGGNATQDAGAGVGGDITLTAGTNADGTTFGSVNLACNTNVTGGDLAITTAGKGLKVKTGSNAKMGKSTLSGGTVTVSTTAVTASSHIFLTHQNAGGVVGVPSVGTVVAGTSFVINSSNVADTSSIAWLIVEPA